MAARSGKSLGYLVVAAVIVLGSLFRIFVCFHFNPVDFLYSDPARHWLNGGHFPKGAYYGGSDPIGYQAFVFVLRKASFDNRYPIAFVSALISVLMPWTYYRAARTFGLAKLPSMWAWALIVWAPSLLVIYHYIMMETLLLLLDGIALWATARHIRKGGRFAFVLSVVLWTAAALTKPTVVPLAAVCVLWSCWKQRPPLKIIATAAVLAFLMLIPQAIRSEVALGFIAPFGNPWLTKIQHRVQVRTLELKFHPHDNEYFHFRADPMYDFFFTSPSCNVKPFAPFSDWQIQRATVLKKAVISIDSAYGERDWKKAYDLFKPDTGDWLKLWRENVVLFLFSPSWPEDESPNWIDHWEPPSRWIWAPIVLFVLVGNLLFFLKRRFDFIPVATTCFTLFLALQNVVIFEGRYRKPLEPLLLLNVVWIIATWARASASNPSDVASTAPVHQQESAPIS